MSSKAIQIKLTNKSYNGLVNIYKKMTGQDPAKEGFSGKPFHQTQANLTDEDSKELNAYVSLVGLQKFDISTEAFQAIVSTWDANQRINKKNVASAIINKILQSNIKVDFDFIQETIKYGSLTGATSPKISERKILSYILSREITKSVTI